ncbi:MAG: ABC transporter permease [Anaerolineales bacterium]|nr:ABC transporter permease [Anaerolineales bacterium]
MIIKNLIRRRGRTLLTVLGISIGVAAIIILGALADGLQSGYDNILTGSKADLVLSQPNSLDISMSSVDEDVGDQLMAMSEVQAVSGMVQGIVTADNSPYFFIYGYPKDGFVLDRFQVVEGAALESHEAQSARGKPILIGTSAAEALHKGVGDSIRLSATVFRIVGIYETGSAFEDGGAVLDLQDAQDLMGRQRQVSLFYVQLKDPSLRERVERRAERLWPDLSLSSTTEFADKQIMGDMMNGYVWGIAGLAIIIGGVGMANAQLMSVFERTREIGVLRAVGWQSWRVLLMILGESIVVSILGGVLGVGLGWLALRATSDVLSAFGANVDSIGTDLLIQAFSVVVILGFVGGIFPARRAAQLEPIEALRYEGGSTGHKQKRLPLGGMAVQSLWQRTTRTLLTMTAIAITVGAIMALEAIVGGAADSMSEMAVGSGSEIMLRQADVSDTSQSVMDEQDLNKIEAMPEVQSVSGVIFTGVAMPETVFFIIQGYAPHELAIRRFKIVEGEPLSSNHQIIIGRAAAEALNKHPGETLEINESRYKVVGIYETGVGWEELGGVLSLRDAQTFTGKPHKVTMASVKLYDSGQAEQIVDYINTNFTEIHASLSGDFADQLPDMEATDAMLGAISFMTILVGSVGIMNTMLMAVLERTREIGALRAMGWRRISVLMLIMKESLLLSILGGLMGIAVAFGLVFLFQLIPWAAEAMQTTWTLEIFIRAISVALFLGLIGGFYPAFRATKMQPVEALRYE